MRYVISAYSDGINCDAYGIDNNWVDNILNNSSALDHDNISEINTFNITVKEGDTFLGILLKVGVTQSSAISIINQTKKTAFNHVLSVGQKVIIVGEKNNDYLSLLHMSIYKERNMKIDIIKDISGRYVVEKKKLESVDFNKRIFKISGEIETNFFNDFKSYNIPEVITGNLVKLYGYEFDFQREIKSGTKFNIIFEKYYDNYGEFLQVGDIIFTSIDTGSKVLSLYRYKSSAGEYDYFNKNGQSVKRALLRTPIDGARISSRFGKRKHPISGYSKMHKGVDFAAPSGTSIYAAGSGVIEEIGVNGGYGKYIRIKHDAKYSTAYAHMSKFKIGLKKGSRVTQGDVIGFVGQTGTATGPHLHYEVIKDGKQIDPMKIQSKTQKQLNSEEILEFRANMDAIDSKL